MPDTPRPRLPKGTEVLISQTLDLTFELACLVSKRWRSFGPDSLILATTLTTSDIGTNI
jgi:hypothetical protein